MTELIDIEEAIYGFECDKMKREIKFRAWDTILNRMYPAFEMKEYMSTRRYGTLVIFYGKDATGKTIMKGISIYNILKR